MLVDLVPRNGGEVDVVARCRHDFGEGGGLRDRHAAQADCHEERRDLVVGNLSGNIAVYDIGKLIRGKFAAVLLLRDDVIHIHGKAPSLEW